MLGPGIFIGARPLTSAMEITHSETRIVGKEGNGSRQCSGDLQRRHLEVLRQHRFVAGGHMAIQCWPTVFLAVPRAITAHVHGHRFQQQRLCQQNRSAGRGKPHRASQRKSVGACSCRGRGPGTQRPLAPLCVALLPDSEQRRDVYMASIYVDNLKCDGRTTLGAFELMRWWKQRLACKWLLFMGDDSRELMPCKHEVVDPAETPGFKVVTQMLTLGQCVSNDGSDTANMAACTKAAWGAVWGNGGHTSSRSPRPHSRPTRPLDANKRMASYHRTLLQLALHAHAGANTRRRAQQYASSAYQPQYAPRRSTRTFHDNKEDCSIKTRTRWRNMEQCVAKKHVELGRAHASSPHTSSCTSGGFPQHQFG